ncbi:MAG: hypothetical protein ABIL07_04915 [candidate division WOR-3 bacterium]
MAIILFLISVNPFNEANFVPLPIRSISVLSNPAGIGIETGAELFFTYHPKNINSGLTLGNLGFGISRADTNIIFEIGSGVKLPGAFSIGYARQFGDTTENIIGLICVVNQYVRLGYKTNLAKKKITHTGAGVRIGGGIITIAGELIYEGIDDSTDFIFGAIINPSYGVKLNFISDPKWNWHAGIELGTTKLKLNALYSYKTRKFSGGIILSAQDF